MMFTEPNRTTNTCKWKLSMLRMNSGCVYLLSPRYWLAWSLVLPSYALWKLLEGTDKNCFHWWKTRHKVASVGSDKARKITWKLA